MEKVEKVGEKVGQKANPKILICFAGTIQIVVPEKFITTKDGFIIRAKQAFLVNMVPSNVSSVTRTPTFDITFSIVENVEIYCNLIYDISEQSQVYKMALETMVKVTD